MPTATSSTWANHWRSFRWPLHLFATTRSASFITSREDGSLLPLRTSEETPPSPDGEGGVSSRAYVCRDSLHRADRRCGGRRGIEIQNTDKSMGFAGPLY